MISGFKKFYDSKTPREKMLLIAIIWAPLLIWCNALIKEQKEASASREMSLQNVRNAELAISKRPSVEENLKRAMEGFNQDMLVADLGVEVERIIHSMNVSSYTMSLLQPKPSGRMIIHSVNVNFKGVDLRTLSDFEKHLIARAPYISMASVELTTDGKGVMGARYEINSFEFNDKISVPNEKNQ